jgi:hypothetical protein
MTVMSDAARFRTVEAPGGVNTSPFVMKDNQNVVAIQLLVALSTM